MKNKALLIMVLIFNPVQGGSTGSRGGEWVSDLQDTASSKGQEGTWTSVLVKLEI